MADKNAKAELNVEDLEGVAGGASVNVSKDSNDILKQGINVLDSMKPTLDVDTEQPGAVDHPRAKVEPGKNDFRIGGVMAGMDDANKPQ